MDTESMTERIELKSDVLSKLFGSLDENVKLIEREMKVNVSALDGAILITGEEAPACRELLSRLIELIEKGYEVGKSKVASSIDLVRSGHGDEILNLSRDTVCLTTRGRQIKCRTLGQREYVRAIKKHTVTFGIGPAGTGKTFLAVALASAAFKAGEVERIVLTRPALEAGEKLGFLPGDLQEKVDPYLRPLYDALGEMFGTETYLRLMERGAIEVAPLAYMRGRTLSNAFIILDEAQNTTNEQMKMFLTRMGEGSRVVVTGDDTQIDLPAGTESGLKVAVSVLEGVDDIAVVRFGEADVVRHELIRRIVGAYAAAHK